MVPTPPQKSLRSICKFGLIFGQFGKDLPYKLNQICVIFQKCLIFERVYLNEF